MYEKDLWYRQYTCTCSITAARDDDDVVDVFDYTVCKGMKLMVVTDLVEIYSS